jgi:hypothetical protein
VAKNAKIAIGIAVVVLLSVVLVASDNAAVGVGVFVLGMLGVAVLYQRGDELDGGQGGGTSKLDRALEDRDEPASPIARAEPSAGGLPTWSPAAPAAGPAAEPFTAEQFTRPPVTPAPGGTTDAPEASAWDAWQDYDRGPVAEDYDDENPLADLDRLGDIDPIAEVERLDGLTSAGAVATTPSSAFSFSSAPKPIDESAVQTSDDIMAASEAVELNVSDGEDSELARLLAKVQQRLAAYE